MPNLERNIEKIKLIVDQYDLVRKDLKNHLKSITKSLEELINEFALDYTLLYKTGDSFAPYYRVLGRIKKGESLKEKFIRANLINKFTSIDFDKLKAEDPKTIEDNREKILELDDLIGVKVLTDLLCDSNKVLQIIKSLEFKNKAIGRNIKINEADLLKQPVIMKNGLPIYKIGACYDNKYNFELQIKSQLISAWGDMEHAIFYKDYAISPVRDTAQKSMIHVGKLLFNLDEFLESIRNADKDYGKNAKALIFMDWIKRNYGDQITKKLGGINFNIVKISEILFAIKENAAFEDSIAKKEMRFGHFDLNGTNSKIKNYIQKRNQSIELQFVESIILSWFLDDKANLNEQNLDETIGKYLDDVIASTVSFLSKHLFGMEQVEIIELLNQLYENGFKYNCEETFMINIKKLTICINTMKGVDDFSDIMDDDENLIKELKGALFIQSFDGDISKFKDNLLDWDKFSTKLIVLIETIDPNNGRYTDLKAGIDSLITKIY